MTTQRTILLRIDILTSVPICMFVMSGKKKA